jgi:hypothetical protein
MGRQAPVRGTEQPGYFVCSRQIGSGAGFQESGVASFLLGNLTGAGLRASGCHVSADPLGDPEHVFEKAWEATMSGSKAALCLEAAARLSPDRGAVEGQVTANKRRHRHTCAIV